MIELSRYTDKITAVYGLSSIGLSSVMALRMSGAFTYFWDENEAIRAHVEQIGLGVCVHPSEWPWAELSVVIPGIDRRRPFRSDHPIVRNAQSHHVPVKSDVELFAEYINDMAAEDRPKIIGIGGSGGKSTCAAFLASLLRSNNHRVCLASDTGKPVLSFNHDVSDIYFILELPARTLAYSDTLSCDCVIYLNTWHIDVKTFSNARDHIDAISKIFNVKGRSNTIIIGVDDPINEKVCDALIDENKEDPSAPAIVPVSSSRRLTSGMFCEKGQLYLGQRENPSAVMQLDVIPALLGAHQYQNLLAALGACLHFRKDIGTLAPAISTLTPLPRRMECLGARDGVVYIDDSLSTTISAASYAISAFADTFWIGGGRNLRQNLSALMGVKDHLTRAYLFGPAAIHLAKELGDKVEINVYTSSYEAVFNAVKDAILHARSNQTTVPTVLYSPGYPPDLTASKTMSFAQIVQPHIDSGVA